VVTVEQMNTSGVVSIMGDGIGAATPYWIIAGKRRARY
jgi:hypothetical protein